MAGDETMVDGMIAAAVAAGDAILSIYATDFASRAKADDSPVTAADEKAEAIILEALAKIAPGVPVVAEEAVAAGRCPEIGDRFFLVDPLDGTKEFISRNGEFTVNIALVDGGAPTAGVVYAPALGRIFAGFGGIARQATVTDGRVRAFTPIAVRPIPAGGLTVVG
ncbi:MAG TPA: inositol monophosphatase family protein, partial [Methylomirabilota bacterium]|nr:inositol monophosphatase family protein [Methylomirabilota bacterium]